MAKGFMRISRKIEDWGWYRDSNTFRVFFHLMLKAQYSNGAEYMGISLGRGQLAIGRKKLSADLGISEQSVRTSLERLTKSHEITIKSTNKYSIITLCNYDSWQCDTLLDNQQTNQQLTNEDDRNQPTTNHIQINKEIDNKDNKDIKEEESNDSKKKEPESEIEIQFEAFRRKYKSYGGKVRGFQTELEDFKKKHKDWKEVIPMLEYAIDKENEARVEANSQKIFFARIQNLKTYLNQRSWEAYSDGWESYDPNAYHPEGFTYDAEFDAYRFCNYIPNYDLLDGYTDDDRPDGARIVEQINVWIWSKEQRRWNRE